MSAVRLLARVTTSNSQSDPSNLDLAEPFYALFNRIFFHTRVLDDDEWFKAFLMGRYTKDHGANQLWHDYLLFRCRDARSEEMLPDRMLSAATYLGYTAVVRDLLEQGHGPSIERDFLFPEPLYIAAWTGQADMLRLLQQFPAPRRLRARRSHGALRGRRAGRHGYGAAGSRPAGAYLSGRGGVVPPGALPRLFFYAAVAEARSPEVF